MPMEKRTQCWRLRLSDPLTWAQFEGCAGEKANAIIPGSFSYAIFLRHASHSIW